MIWSKRVALKICCDHSVLKTELWELAQFKETNPPMDDGSFPLHRLNISLVTAISEKLHKGSMSQETWVIVVSVEESQTRFSVSLDLRYSSETWEILIII